MTTPLLFVAGFGRSGSTLIESALRREIDVLGVGELIFIWDRGVLKNELVGNGVPFRESPFWMRVLDRAFGGVDQATAKEFDQVFQPLRGRKLSAGKLAGQLPKNLDDFARIACPLYDAIAQEAGGRAIVDSSKFPLYGAALSQVLDKPIGVVHAFRDPRAVAFSWSQVKRRAESGGDGQQYMARSKVTLSSVWRWKWFNHQATQLSRELNLPRTLIGYEQFCQSPTAYIDLVKKKFRLGPKRLEDLEWQSVSGNPARFDGSLDKIVLDERWRREMSCTRKFQVKALCARQHASLIKQDRLQFLHPENAGVSDAG